MYVYTHNRALKVIALKVIALKVIALKVIAPSSPHTHTRRYNSDKYERTNISESLHNYIYIYIHTHTHTQLCVYIYIYTYIHTHTSIHIICSDLVAEKYLTEGRRVWHASCAADSRRDV